MNHPNQDSTAGTPSREPQSGPYDTASADDDTASEDDERPGGHVGNPTNLESGAPVVDDTMDD